MRVPKYACYSHDKMREDGDGVIEEGSAIAFCRGWGDDVLELFVNRANGVTLAVKTVQAVDSYNSDFFVDFVLTAGEALRLKNWLNQQLDSPSDP